MPDKRQPIGICDLCLGSIPRDMWYTSKGKPRLHCSIECRMTANSRAGAPIRSAKAKARVVRGEWVNPRIYQDLSPAALSRRNRQIRLREVAAGTWRNPALTDEARGKLSRPRKHSGALAAAIEKLSAGRMVDLTDEERDAYQDYRRQQRSALAARQTPEERERLRAQWRKNYHRYKKPPE